MRKDSVMTKVKALKLRPGKDWVLMGDHWRSDRSWKEEWGVVTHVTPGGKIYYETKKRRVDSGPYHHVIFHGSLSWREQIEYEEGTEEEQQLHHEMQHYYESRRF
jgi:hypothetical protein